MSRAPSYSDAPDYTEAQMHADLRDWFDARDAIEAGDPVKLADALMPEDFSDRSAFIRMLTMVALGAILCATEVSRIYQHPLGIPPQGGYGLLLDGADPWAADPDTTNRRIAAQMITAASNGQFETAVGLARATIRPEDFEQRSGMVLDLLDMWVALGKAPTPEAGR